MIRAASGLLVLMAACRGAAPAAGPAADAEDSTLLYDRASARARQGDLAGALAMLERLEARGWSFCPADRDMSGLVDLPRYRALSARMKARSPKIQRARVAVTIPDRNLAPEGIAYDDDHDTLFAGSMTQRKIVRVAASGETSDFATRASGLYGVLGVRVDAEHGLLWAASSALPSMADYVPADAGKAALFAFDLSTGAPREHLPLADGGSHLLNDVAICPDGSAYVTDSEAGAVWRHRPGDRGLAAFVPAGALRYPNGIACDGPRVLVAHQRGVVVVSATSGERTDMAVPAGATLAGLDGLYLDGDRLLGVQNGFGCPRIVRADLDARHLAAQRMTVLESAHPALDLPTTAALVRRDRRLLVVMPGDPQPPTILSVPIDP